MIALNLENRKIGYQPCRKLKGFAHHLKMPHRLLGVRGTAIENHCVGKNCIHEHFQDEEIEITLPYLVASMDVAIIVAVSFW